MSTALAACDATSSEHTLQSFTALSLKPLLQFITTECLASPPSNLVDFVLQLLEENKDSLYRMCPATSVTSPAIAQMHSLGVRPVQSSEPSFPALITEEAISAFPTTLPPLDEARSSPAVSESYAQLVRSFSESSSHAQSLMRAMNRAWKLSQDFPFVQRTSPSNSVLELFSSAETPDVSAVRSSSVLARDLALLHKLVDAAASSLKRKDKRVMNEVFSRHAKPVGLSAQALVSALHAIDPSSFSAEMSDAAAAKKLKEFETGNKGHADFEEFCQAAQSSCAEGVDTSAARDVYLRFADVKGLSAQALVDALKEVDAPVLLSSEGCSPEQIFRRADVNTSGSVDLAE